MLPQMINLCATGKSNLDGVTPMYLWRKGDYTYEIESKACGVSAVELYEDTPYDVVILKFMNMVDKVEFV